MPEQENLTAPLPTFDGAMDALNAAWTGMAIGTTGYMSPGAGPRRQTGCADRPVLLWFGSVRDGPDWAACVRRRDRRGCARCCPQQQPCAIARPELDASREACCHDRQSTGERPRTALPVSCANAHSSPATPGTGTARKSQRPSWSGRWKLTTTAVIFVVVMAVCIGLWVGPRGNPQRLCS